MSIFILSNDEFITVSAMNCENTNVAIILASGHDYIEQFWVQNYMGSWGSEFTIAGLTTEIAAADGSPTIQADILISEITNITDYDAVFIPGGNLAFMNGLMTDETTLTLLNEANGSGVVIAAICAGTEVLAAADLVNGKNFTTYFSHINVLLAAGGNYVGGQVCTDGNIITAAPPNYLEVSYHIAFALGRNYVFESSYEITGSDVSITLDVSEEKIFKNITLELYLIEEDGNLILKYSGVAVYTEDLIYIFNQTGVNSGDYTIDITFNTFFNKKTSFTNVIEFNVDSPQGLASIDFSAIIVGLLSVGIIVQKIRK